MIVVATTPAPPLHNLTAQRRRKDHKMGHLTRPRPRWILAALLALAVCLASLDQTQAVDPEYELAPRIQQVFDAILNRYVLRYLAAATAAAASPAARPTNATATVTTTASGSISAQRRVDNSGGGGIGVTTFESAIFRCRSGIDAPFGRLSPATDRATFARTLDLNAPLAILIHGWFDTWSRGWFNRTATGYQRHVGGNFCTLDWGYLSQDKYSAAAYGTREVALRLAQFLRHTEKLGISLARVTLIGHSFGAQIAGLCGAALGGRLARIYGLDPAGWAFTKPTLVGKAERLDRADAVYVQCMHTNRELWAFGSGVECGDQDFYPNDGLSPQPGCTNPREDGGMTPYVATCSHYKAVQYFIASLDPANRFKAWSCPAGYEDWMRGRCRANAFDFMGVHSRNRVSGKLYLRTVKEPPYVFAD